MTVIVDRPRPERRLPGARPELLVVGTSTGGPQALTVLFERLSPSLGDLPAVIVLHMPPAFTTIVAERIQTAAQHPAGVARHGERIAAGRIYFAPGDKHLRIERRGDALFMLHDGAPAENFCRPSVDVSFRTAAEACGAGVVGVVLTGMGVDGREGARAIVARGGSVIVQDEESSVVWGMPGAISREGLATAMLPPCEIADAIAAMLHRARRP